MATPEQPPADDPYLTARQAAAYLHVNQKKLYALVAEGAVPATKATGKWLFPRKLLDQWLIESSHGGALADRLVIAGSDDPLLSAAVAQLAADLRHDALVALSPTGTRLGLELLAQRRIDACGIHWGLAETSAIAHPQLVASFGAGRDWTLVRLASREQGVILTRTLAGTNRLAALARAGVRWAVRQEGAGSLHFLRLMLHEQVVPYDALDVRAIALTEREAASLVARGAVDCAPGVRAVAEEFGLAFLPLGWEAFDLVVPRAIYFRALFQRLLERLRSDELTAVARSLRGYDLSRLGGIVVTEIPG